MSTTQRIARVSVEDVQRARGGGVGKNFGGRNKRSSTSNNFRRPSRSSDSKSEEKLVLRDRRLGHGPPAKSHHAGNRARDRGRGHSRDRSYGSSPSRSRDRPGPFHQDAIWEFNQDITTVAEFDRSHHNQQTMAVMQLPINALTAMGQNTNQLNVPGGAYCMVVAGDAFQQQQSTHNSFIQQQRPAQVQFAVPINSDRIVSQHNDPHREQISIQLQSDRDVVMEGVGHGLSSRPQPGDPVGHDAIINVPYCRACSVYIPREKDLELHLRSEKHFRNYFDVAPEVVVNDDTREELLIETEDHGRYDDDGQELYSPSTMDRHRRERLSGSLDQEQDYFLENSRLIRDDDNDGRSYRQTVSQAPAPPPRVILESSRQDHCGSDDREIIDRVNRRPLLSTPPRSLRDNFDQDDTYNRHYERSSPPAPSRETADNYHRQHHAPSSRDNRPPAVRPLPAVPPPPILRPPRDERGSIEFNAPKVMSRDWGKGGNRRGDYGQTFDSNDRTGSVYNNVSHCTICGLKGSYDLRSHMLIAHKMQL